MEESLKFTVAIVVLSSPAGAKEDCILKAEVSLAVIAGIGGCPVQYGSSFSSANFYVIMTSVGVLS